MVQTKTDTSKTKTKANLKSQNLWERLKSVIKRNLGLAAILAAAFILGIASAVMGYYNRSILQDTMERLVEQEMDAIFYRIHNQLSKVEVTLNNMAWVVSDDLAEADSMYVITRRMVENNPAILGGTISFVPNYYPEKGYWFEPYAVRRTKADGRETIETIQLGSESHDYTKSEFFTAPIAKNDGHWCEPYLDAEGAKAMVTTYGTPVHDRKGKTVAVVDADLSLDWLNQVIAEEKTYPSTQRYLVTGSHQLLAGEEGPELQAALRLLTEAHNKESNHRVKNEEGKEQHVFFHPVGGMTDWVLITVLDDNDVFGRMLRSRRIVLFLSLIGLTALGFIVYRTSRNLENLRKVNAAKERIDSDLRVANKIQMSMLPEQHLKNDQVDVFGSLVPAREVGGDLFDYFIRDGKLFFCIGDVSGKGMPSAMLMSSTCSLFRSYAAHDDNPARIMQAINEAACQKNPTHMFVTVFIGVLDLQTGHLCYCNAGHDAPIILSPEFSSLTILPHIAIGLFSTMKYSLQETDLPAGTTFFLYTDGLTEAMDKEDHPFGLERAKAVLQRCAEQRQSPEEIISTISEEVHHFVKAAEQSDDLTLLAISYQP
ncbi:MAG: SpoIIE family protein phosphatase [Prevotella sp.]|nr:SpoIIE family protein phosphatase [Prevotella sp.]